MKPQIDAFVFDLDGTLLDTLPDLVDVTNATMAHFGYPTHTQEEILAMVGNGLRSLITQALPPNLDSAAVNECATYWKTLYDTQGDRKTSVYPGMTQTLDELKARGKKLAVLSNKYDAGTQLMTQRYFSKQMDFALGEGPVPRKPDPAGLLRVAQELDVPIQYLAFIGDSLTDIQTAQRAGALAIAANWGYQPYEKLKAAKPDAIINAPTDVLAFA